MKAYEPRGDMGQREELMRLRREHKHMAMDLDILKSDEIIRENNPVRFTFIHHERECLPLTAL